MNRRTNSCCIPLPRTPYNIYTIVPRSYAEKKAGEDGGHNARGLSFEQVISSLHTYEGYCTYVNCKIVGGTKSGVPTFRLPFFLKFLVSWKRRRLTQSGNPYGMEWLICSSAGNVTVLVYNPGIDGTELMPCVFMFWSGLTWPSREGDDSWCLRFVMLLNTWALPLEWCYILYSGMKIKDE